MSDAKDLSSETHHDTLSSKEVENLIRGTSERPELAELEKVFAEVRSLPKMMETPVASRALSEFVGRSLTPTPEPIRPLDADDPPVSSEADEELANPLQRNWLVGHAAPFFATTSGKVVVGATVAAAAIVGAHATGAIDVPFLPDNTPAVIERIEVPEDPEAPAEIENP